MVEVVGVTVGVGLAFTVTLCVAVAVQFAPMLTVTLYVVFVAGATFIEVEAAPLLQLYVLPPLAVRVMLSPLHTLVGPAIVAVGEL